MTEKRLKEINEIHEAMVTLAEVDIYIELALNNIINIPDKYIEPFIIEYMSIYKSQIHCLVQNIYKQIHRENSKIMEDMFEEMMEVIEKRNNRKINYRK